LRRCSFVLLTILPPAGGDAVHRVLNLPDCMVPSRSVGVIMDGKAHLMAAHELINIREMSKRSSVPAATLRYYEKLGLITSERETRGSHRRYSGATLHRITYITLAQRAGFSLEEIAEQLAMLPNIHPVPPKVWAPLRKKWERRIDQHIAELKQLKIDLRRCTRDASR
jgi:MerR family transcriptional regulator, redox-sensitive transcriptional activator SoxR